MEAFARTILRGGQDASDSSSPSGLAAAFRELRDRAAIAADDLARLPRPDSARVADVLASGEAVLVIAPPSPPSISPSSSRTATTRSASAST